MTAQYLAGTSNAVKNMNWMIKNNNWDAAITHAKNAVQSSDAIIKDPQLFIRNTPAQNINIRQDISEAKSISL